MTHPTTAMEAWQAAYDAWDSCPVTPSLDTEAADQAAASVIEAWASERERELREALQKHAARFDFCASMIEAGFSASGTQRMEHFMKAKAFANEARTLLADQEAGDA